MFDDITQLEDIRQEEANKNHRRNRYIGKRVEEFDATAYQNPTPPERCPRCVGRVFVEDFPDGTDFVCMCCGWRQMTIRRTAFWTKIAIIDSMRGERKQEQILD